MGNHYGRLLSQLLCAGVTVLFLSVLFSLQGCEDEDCEMPEQPVTPDFILFLLDEYWVVRYEDGDGNVLHERPDDLENDIQLVFRKDNRITGHLSSGSLPWSVTFNGGQYTATEDGGLQIQNLVLDGLPINDWDQRFIDTYPLIDSCVINLNSAHFYYDGGTKAIYLRR